MELVSTRNNKEKVSFKKAVLDCIPKDGGLYVPAQEIDLRPWILHLDDTSSFSTIAGTLTSALLKEEFSPVVCEAIATKAFSSFSPQLKQLEEHLYILELFHGPTGCHKDFGLLWLASALEHMLLMEDKKATVLAATAGITGRSLANAFSNKNRLKTILLFPKGTLKGIDPSVLAWNGGNIWPVEINGSLEDAQKIVREIYSNRDLVTQFGLTLANTMNIGRLLPQMFFYMFAFSRLRKTIRGDIFYALPSGNFGNLVAGLYAWKFSLPVNGFITDASPLLSCTTNGPCVCNTIEKPLHKRNSADPAQPSNIERLEQVFEVYVSLLRGLVFPSHVQESALPQFIADFNQTYKIGIDSQTALAFGAIKKQRERIFSDEGTVVLVAKDDPRFDPLSSKINLPTLAQTYKYSQQPVVGAQCLDPDAQHIITILQDFAL